MKNVKTVALSLMVVFSLVLLLAGSGVAQMQDMEGNVICVEVDEKGNTVAKEQFTECKGAFVLVGKDGKLYSVSGTEETVTGNIVCLLPSYEKGNVTPMVGTGPCNEAVPHAHVVTTASGQVYILSGSEDAISSIEKSPQRTNVTLSGKVTGNQGAWILYVQ